MFLFLEFLLLYWMVFTLILRIHSFQRETCTHVSQYNFFFENTMTTGKSIFINPLDAKLFFVKLL